MDDKDVLILAAVWARNRLVLSSPKVEQADLAYLEIAPFIPDYRQLVFCGDVPKEHKFRRGAKSFPNDDPSALKDALLEALAEEESGIDPCQIVYFSADRDAFRDVLAPLDRGWIATTACPRAVLEETGLTIAGEMEAGGAAVWFLDSDPEDMFIERNLLAGIRHCDAAARRYLIQIEQSRIHLAFQAVRNEIESGRRITQSELADAFGLRTHALKKVVEIGRRERRIDISPYIEETHPKIVAFLKEALRDRDLSLAAILDGSELIGYGRLKDLIFPVSTFRRIVEKAEGLAGRGPDGGRWNLELKAENENIYIARRRLTYCFLFSSGENFPALRLKLSRIIEALERGETPAFLAS